jgi:alkanesulfonate monooxygenase SsuD/methylene tetrahydromethanopterin reductase-like flavin-dependent oxidoreductase (luciferase family)
MALDTLDADQRAALTARFIVGDPDTVGERLAADKTLGVDGFTANLPANGYMPGRVTLLGDVMRRVVA